MKKHYIIDIQYQNYTLRRYLRTKFPHLSQDRIHKSIRKGDIRINGLKTHVDAILHFNDTLNIWDTLLNTDVAQDLSKQHEYGFLKDKLIERRNDVWCFNKPQGLAMQGGTNLKTNMCQLLTGWMNQYTYIPRHFDDKNLADTHISRHIDDKITNNDYMHDQMYPQISPSVQTNTSLPHHNPSHVIAPSNPSHVTTPHSQSHAYQQISDKCKPYIVHRLDRNTSGCCLFATNAFSANILARAFEDRLIKKHYVAICEMFSDIPTNGRIELDIDGQYACTDYVVEKILCNNLAQDSVFLQAIGYKSDILSTAINRPDNNHVISQYVHAIHAVHATACPSNTTHTSTDNSAHHSAQQYKNLQHKQHCSDQASEYTYHTIHNHNTSRITLPNHLALISFFPITGRKHQIRKHITSLDCPILGDNIYNPGTIYKHMCLHAKSISFTGNNHMSGFHYTAALPIYMQKIIDLSKQ